MNALNINALSINGLVKIYEGGKVAVNDVDMTVEMGGLLCIVRAQRRW